MINADQGRLGIVRVVAYPFRHLRQRFQLLGADQFKFGDKVVKVLVAGVNMSLGADWHNPVKVVYVNMNKYPEEAR